MSVSNLEMSKANKMNKLNDLTTGLSQKDVTKFRFDEINKIKDYLNIEIKERKDIVKKIS